MSWPAFSNRAENPYNSLLYSAVADQGIDVIEYSAAKLLFGRKADILHLHWSPTMRVSGSSHAQARRRSREMLFLLRVAKRRGMKIVWTAHNLGAHDRPDFPDLERRYWPALAATLSTVISLSASAITTIRARYPALKTVPFVVTPHGHYRGAYPCTIDRAQARARLGIPNDARVMAFVGQVRPYKNVPALLRAFGKLDDPSAVLIVAGKMKLQGTASEFDALAAADPRVRVIRGFVPPDDMQIYLQAANLVALPFRDTLNSGSAILALSFDRPVLVPRNAALTDLAHEVGDEWVMTYDDTLTPAILASSLDSAMRLEGRRAPLDAFEWPRIASQTGNIYHMLVRS